MRSPSEDRSRQKLLYAPCFFWAVVKPHRYRYQSSVTEPPQFVQQAPFGAMLHIVRGTVATAETVSHVASPLPCISVYQCVLRSALNKLTISLIPSSFGFFGCCFCLCTIVALSTNHPIFASVIMDQSTTVFAAFLAVFHFLSL